MLGAQSARKTKSSSSLGIDDRVANVFRQGGGSPAARVAIMVVIGWLESFSYAKQSSDLIFSQKSLFCL